MKTKLRLLSLYLITSASVLCCAASPKMPDDIAHYYDDFNRLTMLKLEPPKIALSNQPFALEAPSPEISAAAALQQRLNERRLSVNPRFSPRQTAPIHERVFVRITAYHAANGQITVQCEVYEPPIPTSKPVSELPPIDFTGLKLLRREAHQWRAVADQWILYGSIQQLTNDA